MRGITLSDDNQFLSIKNWEKFQPKLKNGKNRRDWIRIDTNRVDDPEYSRLSIFERGALTAIMELVGRTGKWPPNDPIYVARAVCMLPEERHCLSRTIHKLVVSGFLILCNQQMEVEFALQDKTGHDKTIQKTIPLRGKAPKKQEPVFELPLWVPKEAWDGFVEMKAKSKFPLKTERSKKLTLTRLEKLRASGNDPTEVLDHATMQGWRGLWPVNGNGTVNAKKTDFQLIDEWQPEEKHDK